MACKSKPAKGKATMTIKDLAPKGDPKGGARISKTELLNK